MLLRIHEPISRIELSLTISTPNDCAKNALKNFHYD